MARGTILLVEGDGVLAAHLRDTLTALGYTVKTPVSTGRDAASGAADLRPDLVLTDSGPAGEGDDIAAVSRDITDRKPAKADNARRGEFWRAILRTMSDGFWITDMRGRFVEVNDAYCAMSGYTREEMLGMRIPDVEYLETEDEVMTRIERVARDGVDRFETRHRRKDGSPLELEISLHFLNMDGGSFVCFCRDIGERKQAAQALRERERELARAQAVAQTGVWRMDLRNNLLHWSAETHRIFGISEGTTITNEVFYETVHPDDRERARQSWINALNGEPYDIEHRIVVDGVVKWVREQAELDFDENGVLRGGFGVVQDITGHKKSEEALRERERELTRAQSVARTGSWRQDVRSNELHWSAETYRIFGIPEGTPMISESFFEMVHPEDREWVKRAWDAALRGEPYDIEHRIVVDGAVKWVRELSELEFDQDGVLRGGFGIVQDITGRKRDEEALRESEGRVRAKLQAVLEPEGDLGTLSLEDVLDIPALQSMMDDFYRVTPVPVAIVDIEGKVLIGAGWQDVCTRFHRVHPETSRKCTECDTLLARGVEPGAFKSYQCRNGLWESVTPLFVGERHVGNIFTGQYFFEDTPPDFGYFRAQAREYGFAGEEYLAAVRRAPIVKRESITAIMKFFIRLAGMISSLSYGNLRLARTLAERDTLLDSLRRSEEKYRLLVETSREIIVVAQGDRLVFANDIATEILGYSNEELRAGSFARIVHPEDRDTIVANYRGRLAGAVLPDRYTFRVLRKDGGTRWMEISAARIEWEGKPATLNFLTDITERKQAEEALRESERSYRELFEKTPIGIFQTTSDGRVIAVNPAMASILGFDSSGEAIARYSDLARQLWVDPSRRMEFIRQISENGSVEGFEYEARRADGRCIWISMNARVSGKGEEGSFTIDGFSMDITEQHRAREALRESEERFRTAFRVSPDSININRLSDGVYVDINEGFTRIMGYTREDSIGVSSLGLDIWADPEDRKRLLTGLKRDGTVSNLEARFRRKDGGVVTGLMSASIISLEGEPYVLSITRDITDRKRAEATLRENEVKYRTVADFTYDWEIWRLPDGSHAYISPSCERISGYSAEEFLADPEFFFSIVHPEDRERVRDHLREELEQELELFTYDFRIITREGEERWLNHFCLPVYGEDGEWLGRRASNRDITNRKQAETALLESETRWRSYIENAPYGIFIADETGRYLQVNPAASSITGYSKAELLTMRIPDLTPPEWRNASGESFARLASTGYTYIEIPFMAKSGEMRLWSVAAVKLSPDRFLGYANDITERRRSEEEIKMREAFLRKIFEILPVGLWFTDKTGKLVEGNPAGIRIWGAEPHVNPSEYGVFRARRLPSGEELAPEDWALAHTVREKATILDELLEIDAFDGKKRVILNSTAPVLDDAGEFQGAIVVNQDITEMRRLEHQLLQSQKMETIGRLAGGIAHDFNNILTVINATAEMSLMFLSAEDPTREAFEEIRKAGDRAAALTSQILAFSRRQIIEPKVICLNRILLDMDKMLRRIIGEHIELITIPDEELRTALVDPGQIEQVLTNLAVNARDAMPQGGKLTIETRNVELDTEYAENHPETVPGDYVMLAVSDTGCGMSEDVRTRAFEPFFTTKPKGSGTGLGLSTCYGIVKQNNGGIWIYSEPGRGTTIKLYLPAISSATENGEVRESGFSGGTETVLLVEDDPSIRRLVSRILERAGYRVHTASNGSEALSLVQAEKGPFHLLVTDVVMPLMGGRELAEALHSLHPEVRVLFMSGYTDNSIVHHGILQEGIMFIQKPFSPGSFLRKVRETLER